MKFVGDSATHLAYLLPHFSLYVKKNNLNKYENYFYSNENVQPVLQHNNQYLRNSFKVNMICHSKFMLNHLIMASHVGYFYNDKSCFTVVLFLMEAYNNLLIRKDIICISPYEGFTDFFIRHSTSYIPQYAYNILDFLKKMHCLGRYVSQLLNQ